jgi:flagellar capping protein FliD
VTSFLGSPDAGGFLKNAADALNRTSISVAKNDIDTQITNLTNTIAVKQSAVDNLQTRLEAQMAAADALIASLEQQYTFLSSVFSAQQTASESYK